MMLPPLRFLLLVTGCIALLSHAVIAQSGGANIEALPPPQSLIEEDGLALDSNLQLLDPAELEALYNQSARPQNDGDLISEEATPPLNPKVMQPEMLPLSENVAPELPFFREEESAPLATSSDFLPPSLAESPLEASETEMSETPDITASTPAIDQATAPVTVPAEAVSAEAIADDSTRPTPLVIGDSLMFTLEETERVINAINQYARRSEYGEADIPFLETLEEGTEQEPTIKEKDYLLVTLNSLLYVDKSHWSVWINGARFTTKNPAALPRMKVEEVTENNATIRLNLLPTPPPSTADSSDQTVSSTGDVIISDTSNFDESETIDVTPSAIGEVLKFTLKPNQSYIITDNAVMEGTVASRRIREILASQTPIPAANATGDTAAIGQTDTTSSPTATNINGAPKKSNQLKTDLELANEMMSDYKDRSEKGLAQTSKERIINALPDAPFQSQ